MLRGTCITILGRRTRMPLYEVVPEDIFFTVHFPTIYMDPLRAACIPSNLHVLSLFAMVLAIGALFDLALPIAEVQPRSAELYAVALSALDLRFPVNFDSISAAQSLHLMALWFLCMRGEEGGDSAWQALGLAMRSIVAQECHRDDSSWGLPPREAEERRRVFWETLVFDRLQSFTLGRPYALSDAHHNCEMPQTCDTPLPSDTDPEDRVFSHLKWHTLKFRFALLLGRIVDTVLNARQTPTYEVVLDMDRDVQSYYASLPGWAICEAVEHPVTALPSPDELRPAKDGLQMRRDAQIASLANMCFLAILDLHRGPFCRALMLGGRNLVSSKYKQSVESLTNAARAMINVARGLFARHPRLFSRMWYWIFHSFTAAVCQAVFVIGAPRHPLAPAAYESMQSALHLYARADGEHSKAASERLVRLAAQARSEMDKAHRVASISIEDTPPTRVAFPTSNIRGNVAEDFLGTSPTLVRSAPEPQHDKDASQHSPWPQPESDWIDHNYQFDAQTRLFHSEQPGSQQFSASRYFSEDGFDVTAFIQSGARPWMFDN
ncbi:unnamed protein product [Mycena citricolor]|uniref:Xylanolytic transcriptional activator regulatory domain-containing protein n=1 Tax=Mycena citricolor TaxID=2018698 RepID=A0AAD2HUG1_9AGAR|nr:unnamed protein product [Mycena citricolor]